MGLKVFGLCILLGAMEIRLLEYLAGSLAKDVMMRHPKGILDLVPKCVSACCGKRSIR